MEMDPTGSERYCYDPVLLWNPQVEDYFTKAYGPDHFARISKALTYCSLFIPEFLLNQIDFSLVFFLLLCAFTHLL